MHIQQPCIASGLAATGCKITDIYCLCNNPVFTNVTGRCEAETCSMTVNEGISTAFLWQPQSLEM